MQKKNQEITGAENQNMRIEEKDVKNNYYNGGKFSCFVVIDLGAENDLY